MSTSKNKGKQISVIVAGATGSTGRHVVSRLVSHPDVSRVVALVRHPIPVNRWTTVFPQLNTSDALRCLSVVTIDWEKMINDVSKVPLSYVAEGVWDYNAERGLRSASHRHLSLHQYQQLRKLRSGSDYAGNEFMHGIARTKTLRDLFGRRRAGGALSVSATKHGRANGGEGSSATQPQKRVGYVQFTHYTSPTIAASSDAKARSADGQEELDIMAVGTGKAGLLGLHKAGLGSSGSSSASSSSSSGSSTAWSAQSDDPFLGPMSDEERVLYGKAFLQQMLQTPFYQTIFAGHHVAINCIGTGHWLSSRYLAAVDYDLSIAFAKAVRIFNCMTHAEANEVEDEILVEQANNAMDSVLWKEIYSACYGKRIDVALPNTGSPTARGDCDPALAADGSVTEAAPLSTSSSSPSEPGTTPASVADMADEAMMFDGKALPDPLSVSVGSGVVSGAPGMPIVTAGPNAIIGSGAQAGDKDFLRNLTSYGAVATLRHFTQLSARSANPNSLVPYLCVHGQRDKELLFMFNQVSPRSKNSGFLRSLFSRGDPLLSEQARTSAPTTQGSVLHRILFGGGTVRDNYTKRKLRQKQEDEADLSDSEKVAVSRLQLLLRRDRVKVWDLADLTIWRPGVFRRRVRQRWLERVFTLVERPVDVKLLAECIVDDIVENVGRERAAGESHRGTVKVINGQSVSRRVHMKAVEDGLDVHDARHGSNLVPEPLLRLPLRIALVIAVAFLCWALYVAFRVAAEL